MKKRLIALLLTVVMVCTLLPIAAFADDAKIVASGSCGTNATWTLDENGLLTISGTGDMKDYDSIAFAQGRAPWASSVSKVKSLIIENGITRIGNNAFCSTNIATVTIPGSVKSVGYGAFYACSLLKCVNFESGLTVIESSAFGKCKALTTLNLPDTLTTINTMAFGSCPNLLDVVLPDSVQKISNQAFEDCTSLKSLTFGPNVKTIGAAILLYNTNKIDIYFSGTSTQYKAINIDSDNTELNKATIHYNHTHEYTFAGTVSPTCTEKGYDKYVCVHGDYRGENAVAALGHTVEVIPGYPATYETEGLSDGKRCSVCGTTLAEQKPLPLRIDYIDNLYISDLSRPEFGQKLDYDMDITTDPEGRLITEGDKAPVYEWYAYNNYTGEYDLITDPDYVCDARSHRLLIYLYPAEHAEFSKTIYWCNNDYINQTANKSKVSKIDNNGVCIQLDFWMYYDKAHTIRTINYTDMPYCCIVGDRVDAFTPAKLQDDGKTGDYFWYLEKLDSDGDVVGMYIAKSQEATALKLMPELTSSDIADMRSEFGTTFKNGYYYAIYNVQILPSTYRYDYQVKINATFRNGDTDTTELEGQPYNDVLAMSIVPVLLDTVKITTPDAPNVSISKTDGKIKLSWNAVPGADKYWIYRSTDGKNFKYYDTTTKTSYTNGSVTSGTKYYYKVKAVNVDGSKEYISSYSSAKSTIPLTTPSLTVSLSAGAAKLSWGAVTGATKYWIYRSTDGKNFKYYDSTTKTSYTNSSVTADGTYYYKVKAIKTVNGTDWTSDYSAAKSVNILKAPDLSIAKADGKIKLSWNAVDGAAKYWIYRSTDGTNYKYYDTTYGTTYTNSSVTSGTKYYYKVKAANADGGASVYSSAKSTVPIKTPVLAGELNNGKVLLSWGAVDGASKYWIYRSTDGENFKYYDSTTKTTYTNSSVTEGTTYYYKIKAAKTIGSTDWASDFSNLISIDR